MKPISLNDVLDRCSIAEDLVNQACRLRSPESWLRAKAAIDAASLASNIYRAVYNCLPVPHAKKSCAKSDLQLAGDDALIAVQRARTSHTSFDWFVAVAQVELAVQESNKYELSLGSAQPEENNE